MAKKEDCVASYLQWLATETATAWWHDSGDPEELQESLVQGASGVTTNPVLVYRALATDRGSRWAKPPQRFSPRERAEALTRLVVTDAAQKLFPTYERTGGCQGYVCAQVDPAKAGSRGAMFSMARRFHQWAPNVAVKLPVTAAGLDVLEECIANSITVTATVSFTVPQVLAVAERHRRGCARARQAGREPGRCFAVLMVGRLDGYLRDVAADHRIQISEQDLRQAGLAVAKRAYALYQEREYETVLLIAALRGSYHITELAGGDLILSIHPRYRRDLLAQDPPKEERIGIPISQGVLQQLYRIPEFIRAYEPEGMKPEEFITFGATQRTLAQFTEAGWALLETWNP